jgi:AcrR family transcriptional regulator
MAGNDRASDRAAAEAAGATPTSRREQAVARSLDSARSRAEKRVQRFLDTAVELMATDAGSDFTVQELVARSRQSLRSFYQYFAGKHELLLALFEESVRATAGRLEEAMAAEDDPLDRLHRFTVEYYRLCRPAPPEESAKRAPTPALSAFARRLLTDHPKEAAQAYLPLVTLLERVLDDAAAAGRIRPGLDHRRIVGVLLQAIGFHAFSTTISGSSRRADDERAAAEQLWSVLVHGIGTVTGTGR